MLRTPRIITANEHGISPAQIDKQAIAVIQSLKSSGYSGELVGGCVRDLLLNRTPKDFDVCTNALPGQIEKVFRRSKVIGRRFRLVLVNMGRETIQVTTYRSQPRFWNSRRRSRDISKKGKVLKDNYYGNIEQDVFRRDLTVNALYLHPSDMRIVDYTNGFDDIQNRVIRVIGDAEHRYREDPVRMLRTMRFAAELDFRIDSKSLQPISKMAELIADVSHMRLVDEIIKLFFQGNAQSTFLLLREHGLFSSLFPAYADGIQDQFDEESAIWLNLLFEDTDSRVRSGQPLSLIYTIAAILWFPYRRMIGQKKKRKYWESHNIAQNLLLRQMQSTFLSKEQRYRIREIWRLQYVLEKRSSNAVSISRNGNFRAALRLLELRSRFCEIQPDVCKRWIPFRIQQKRKKYRYKKRSGKRRS